MLNLIKFSQYFRGGKLVTRGGGGEIPGLPPPLNETLCTVCMCHVHVCVRVYVYVRTCTCVCARVYMYTHAHTRIMRNQLFIHV